MKRLLCLLLTLALGCPVAGAAHAQPSSTERTQLAVDYIPTNSIGRDEEYIVVNTSQASETWRWCDMDHEIVYRFDLTQWDSPQFRIQISNNYLISVSADGTNFTVVADYGELSGKVFDGSYYNTTFYTIDPTEYGCEEQVYLRIANCYPTGGWGGAVSSISVFHWIPEATDETLLYGDVNSSGKVDASDALLALQHSVGLTTLTEQEIEIGDLDRNGRIDASDALQILQLSVGLIEDTAASRYQSAVIHPGDRILFVGDSVTDANRDRSNPDDLGSGYVSQIQTLLSAESSGFDLTLINRGLNGTRTHDWLPIIADTLDETKPDVVSVALGINDTWRRYDSNMPTTAEDYGDNLRTILSAAQRTGAKLVVISPFAISGSSVDITGWHEQDLNDKIAMCEQVAKEFGALYIPMDDIFRETYGGDVSYTLDGVHPSTAGCSAMAMEWISRVPHVLSTDTIG